VTACATCSPKGAAKSQDRAATFNAEGALGCGVVVCDGVGAYGDSGLVAQQVCDDSCTYLSEIGVLAGIPAVVTHAQGRLDDPVDGATTLLALGVDPEGHVSYCLVGNGCLVEIEPIHLGAPTPKLLWSDMALPQISLAEGRPALRSILRHGLTRPIEIASGTRAIDPFAARMYLACTDGIATNEERRIGEAPDGSTWKEIPRPLARLLRELAVAWPELVTTIDPQPLLEQILQQTLDDLLATGALDDDATVGAVLVRPTADEPLDTP
jgi:hypothetical protein